MVTASESGEESNQRVWAAEKDGSITVRDCKTGQSTEGGLIEAAADPSSISTTNNWCLLVLLVR